MARSGVPRKSALCPHSAVKRPHWVRKKFQYEILGIFDQILLYERPKMLILILELKLFEILSNFDVSKIEILLSKIITMLKIV